MPDRHAPCKPQTGRCLVRPAHCPGRAPARGAHRPERHPEDVALFELLEDVEARSRKMSLRAGCSNTVRVLFRCHSLFNSPDPDR